MKNSEILDLSTEDWLAGIGRRKQNSTKLNFVNRVPLFKNQTVIQKAVKNVLGLNIN